MEDPVNLVTARTSRTLTVLWCGTSGDLASQTTQIGFFARFLCAVNITANDEAVEESSHDYVIAFDGCGVTHGFCGAVCAVGVRSQAQTVVERTETLLTLGGHLRINVVGLSRGGIAAMLLAQKLAHISPMRLEAHLLLFDPVPGNLICESKLWTPCARLGVALSNANAVTDLRSCTNLRSVLAIYPVEALPACCLHAPVFARYPSPAQCRVVEDAVLGCHQGALFVSSDLASLLSFVRIARWLTRRGSPLSCTAAVTAFPGARYALRAAQADPWLTPGEPVQRASATTDVATLSADDAVLASLESWALKRMSTWYGIRPCAESGRVAASRWAHAASCFRTTVVQRRVEAALLNRYHAQLRDGVAAAPDSGADLPRGSEATRDTVWGTVQDRDREERDNFLLDIDKNSVGWVPLLPLAVVIMCIIGSAAGAVSWLAELWGPLAHDAQGSSV